MGRIPVQPSEEAKKETLKYANYMVMTHNTIHATAKIYNVKPNRVSHCLYRILPKINSKLSESVIRILKRNFEGFTENAHKANIRKGEIKQRILEDELISRLVDKDNIVIHISDINAICGSTTSRRPKVHLFRLLQREECVLKLVEYDRNGFYRIKAKEEGESSSIPSLSDGFIEEGFAFKEHYKSLEQIQKLEKVNIMKEYVLKKLRQSEDGTAMVASSEFRALVNMKAETTIRRYIDIFLQEVDCPFTREYARNERVLANKFILKERKKIKEG